MSFLVSFFVMLTQIKHIYREEYVKNKCIYDETSLEYFFELQRKNRKKQQLMAVVACISIPLTICLASLMMIKL